MKSAVVLAVLVGAAFGAPKKNIDETLRTKKSPSYGAPCGGGAGLAPVSLYLSQPGIQIPHYRENEHEEHLDEKARSYYGSPAGAVAAPGLAGLPLSATAAAPSGPAVGVFPNAKVGGCAVPLLLSCAPNVVSGYLSHHGAAGGAYHSGPGLAVAAYRDHDHEHKMREVAEEKAWSESERSNLQALADTHEAQPSHQHALTASFHQPAPIQNMKQ